ncbi:MAG: hypothetical protein ACD_75C02011G0005 [uncultured bacterium]|nr:MAG: hypothetical protein ACD_75C02011G0005 [uncultured bacterium]
MFDDIIDRQVQVDSFPVGQHMGGNEIDMGRELRVFNPDVPGFGGTYRHIYGFPDPIEIFGKLLDRHLPPQDRFVADNNPDDVAIVFLREANDRFNLAVVFLQIFVEPGAKGYVQAMFLGHGRDFGQDTFRRVEPNGMGLLRHQLQIGIDFRNGWQIMIALIVPGLHRREGKPLNPFRPRRFDFLPVQHGPETDGNDCNSDGYKDVGSCHRLDALVPFRVR